MSRPSHRLLVPTRGRATGVPRPAELARVVLAACIATSVAACGSSSQGDGAAGTPTTTAAATAASTAAAPSESAEPPTVAVTTNILGDVTRAVAAGEVEVLDLMPRGADPHSYALSAADAERVSDSDLVIANGLGLEEGIVGVIERATDGGVEVIEVAPLLDPLPIATGGDPDPHVWTDPSRMIRAVEIIADELDDLVGPDAATRIDAAADDYIADLRELDVQITERVAALPEDRRRLVTNHHVLGYFADHYGFEVLGAVLPSGTTLASPSAADLADLAELIRDSGVPAIFAETSQPDRLVEVLAEEVGIEITIAELYSESLGDPDGPAGSYLAMMRYNADTIIEALADGSAPG